MTELNQEEISVLEKKFKSSWNFQKKIGLIGLAIGTITLFIPVDILGKARRRGVSGSMIDDFGFVQSFLLMILTIGVFWIIMYFVMNIHNFIIWDLLFYSVIGAGIWYDDSIYTQFINFTPPIHI